jgi:hypothetical protein
LASRTAVAISLAGERSAGAAQGAQDQLGQFTVTEQAIGVAAPAPDRRDGLRDHLRIEQAQRGVDVMEIDAQLGEQLLGFEHATGQFAALADQRRDDVWFAHRPVSLLQIRAVGYRDDELK